MNNVPLPLQIGDSGPKVAGLHFLIDHGFFGAVDAAHLNDESASSSYEDATTEQVIPSQMHVGLNSDDMVVDATAAALNAEMGRRG
jgi:murein L,D-transpeptidase YcbB/YkuD